MIANMLPVGLEDDSSAAEVLAQPVPPSERGFEVFLMVSVEQASTRAAAKQFGVSQTRIMQIRDRVAEWIGANVPAPARLSERQRVMLSAHVANLRTDHLLALAVEAWHGSRGEETVIRTNGRRPPCGGRLSAARRCG
jgi:hypothetical protein